MRRNRVLQFDAFAERHECESGLGRLRGEVDHDIAERELRAGVQENRALGGTANRYLILYELETADAVGGPSYIARLNAPTPWSKPMLSAMPATANR